MLIKHLSLDVNIKTVDLAEDEHLKPEILKMNPAYWVPTLDDIGFYFVGKPCDYAIPVQPIHARQLTLTEGPEEDSDYQPMAQLLDELVRANM